MLVRIEISQTGWRKMSEWVKLVGWPNKKQTKYENRTESDKIEEKKTETSGTIFWFTGFVSPLRTHLKLSTNFQIFINIIPFSIREGEKIGKITLSLQQLKEYGIWMTKNCCVCDQSQQTVPSSDHWRHFGHIVWTFRLCINLCGNRKPTFPNVFCVQQKLCLYGCVFTFGYFCKMIETILHLCFAHKNWLMCSILFLSVLGKVIEMYAILVLPIGDHMRAWQFAIQCAPKLLSNQFLFRFFLLFWNWKWVVCVVVRFSILFCTLKNVLRLYARTIHHSFINL